jgi:hypothetical protein
MLALAAYRAGLCPSCGRPLAECTTGEGKWRVPPPTRCHATTAVSIAQSAHRESPQPEALLYFAERR